jgi:hypothetical protein
MSNVLVNAIIARDIALVALPQHAYQTAKIIFTTKLFKVDKYMYREPAMKT